MAFQLPNVGQARQNRKILEELQEQKKRLRFQSTPPGTPAGGGTVVPATATNSTNNAGPAITPLTQSAVYESQHMTPAQRTALQHAHANSVGYFVTQDSSFGNLILPVLPRFDWKVENNSS